MTSSHITYALQRSRVSEFHQDAAAVRLANEVTDGHRAGARTRLVKRLRAWGARARGPQPRPAADAR